VGSRRGVHQFVDNIKKYIFVLVLLASNTFAGSFDIYVEHQNGFNALKNADELLTKGLEKKGYTVIDNERDADYRVIIDSTRDPMTIEFTFLHSKIAYPRTKSKGHSWFEKRAEKRSLSKILNTVPDANDLDNPIKLFFTL